ncbi:MAG: ABC transporter permease, partial [Ruminococcus sp.]|nr:ABC transporter permease [Ruminococcus sp.]
NADAEKYSATALKTLEENGKKSEEVSVYGIQSDSAYLDLDWKTKDDGVIISTAYANKLNIEEGDTITVKESYGDKEYTFHVDGVYDYPAAIAMFMPQESFNKTFDFDADSFNGYFSNTKITDIDDLYIATVITVDDMTKTSR